MRIKVAVKLATCLDRTLQLAAKYQRTRKHVSLFKEAISAARDVGIDLTLDDGDVQMSYESDGRTVFVDVFNPDEVVRVVHLQQQKGLMMDLVEHEFHGKYALMLMQSGQTDPFTHRIFAWSDISCDVEAALVALRERFWMTRAYCTHVLRIDVGGDGCRHCGQEAETIEHALGHCGTLAPTAYLTRHNNTLKPLAWWLMYAYGVHGQLRGWNDFRMPEAITENERIKIWWDVPVFGVSGRELRENRPDMRVLFKREKRLVVVEMACPLDSNVPDKYTEKANKYGDVIDELREQHAVEANKVEYVPLVIGALGRVDKGMLLEGLRVIMGVEKSSGGEVKRVGERMQKAVIMGSVYIARAYFKRPARRG
jgi:hypothetical protein